MRPSKPGNPSAFTKLSPSATAVEIKHALLKAFGAEIRKIQKDKTEEKAMQALRTAVEQIGADLVNKLVRTEHDFELFVNRAVAIANENRFFDFNRNHVLQALGVGLADSLTITAVPKKPNKYTNILAPFGLEFREELDSFKSNFKNIVEGPALDPLKKYKVVVIKNGNQIEVLNNGEAVRFHSQHKKHLYFDDQHIRLDLTKYEEYLFLVEGEVAAPVPTNSRPPATLGTALLVSQANSRSTDIKPKITRIDKPTEVATDQTSGKPKVDDVLDLRKPDDVKKVVELPPGTKFELTVNGKVDPVTFTLNVGSTRGYIVYYEEDSGHGGNFSSQPSSSCNEQMRIVFIPPSTDQ